MLSAPHRRLNEAGTNGQKIELMMNMIKTKIIILSAQKGNQPLTADGKMTNDQNKKDLETILNKNRRHYNRI